MIGNGNVTATCMMDHSDYEFTRQGVSLGYKNSYFNKDHTITEMISQKGESWVSINKDNKTMTYSIKCAFFDKSLVY